MENWDLLQRLMPHPGEKPFFLLELAASFNP